jgi:hypothetical protein
MNQDERDSQDDAPTESGAISAHWREDFYAMREAAEHWHRIVEAMTYEAEHNGPSAFVGEIGRAHLDDPTRATPAVPDRTIAELDAAWAEAAAAMPDGWFISNVRQRTLGGRYAAAATLSSSATGANVSGFGPTAASALLSLAAALRAQLDATPAAKGRP